jgi:hypothetical protein
MKIHDIEFLRKPGTVLNCLFLVFKTKQFMEFIMMMLQLFAGSLPAKRKESPQKEKSRT